MTNAGPTRIGIIFAAKFPVEIAVVIAVDYPFKIVVEIVVEQEIITEQNNYRAKQSESK